MNVVLLIDCSGSMYGTNIEQARKAALSFVERSLGPNRQIAVIAFPGGIVCPLTGDPARLENAIKGLTPIGSTPLADGLLAAREMMKNRAGVQRIYMVLTDGHPDDPEAAVAEVNRIRTSGGRVITIGVGSQVRPEFLKSLASRAEDYHFCNESVELQGTFINLATELSGGQNGG